MSLMLTVEMRKALADSTEQSVEVVDPATSQVYVLLPKDRFERLLAISTDQNFDPRELYPLISKTAGDAGWADPSMDVYNDYEANRGEGQARCRPSR
jgi:hypothetical protein